MPTNQFKIEVSTEAEIDFDASYEYYSSNSLKAANRFYETINNYLEFISKNPSAFPDVFNGVRKYVVHKFPFVIYYQISQNIIKVIAIFHTSRKPEILKSRI